MIYERVRRFLSEHIRGQASQTTGRVALGSSVGRVRKENQDRAIVAEFIFPSEPSRDRIALAVCDGIGGMAGGEAAAEMAAAEFVSAVFDGLGEPIEMVIQHAAERANRLVFKEFKGKGGSTLVGAILDTWNAPVAISVGDSRVYAVDQWKELLQLSRDDNLGALEKIGNIRVDPAQASHLTQFIGMGDGVEPNSIGVPENSKRLILTSDGIHGMSAVVLREFAIRIEDELTLVQALIAASNHLGGKDNSSAIVTRMPIQRPSLSTSDGLIVRLATPFASTEIWLPVPQRALATEKARSSSPAELVRKAPRTRKSAPPSKRVREASPKVAPATPELKLDFPGEEN